ncbi:MAG: hypothetical protein ABIH49_00755 [archaeon]
MIGKALSVMSQGINILIFIYFALILIKINALDIIGLSISAFGILMSLLADTIDTIENIRK